jgi:hypothetical protein
MLLALPAAPMHSEVTKKGGEVLRWAQLVHFNSALETAPAQMRPKCVGALRAVQL